MLETSSIIRQPFERTEKKDSTFFGGKSAIRGAAEYFSAKSFRLGQREAIEKVDEAFQSGYRYVVLSAPTGIGKSHIAMSFARQAELCHILTVQKILQDQYARDFGSEVAVMKGRSSYMCLVEKGFTCAAGPCRKKKSFQRHADCPYQVALSNAMQSRIVVHNFDSFYYQSNFSKRFFERDLLITDE